MFNIRMGIPEMDAFWNELVKKIQTNTATADEKAVFSKLGKALYFLSQNPRHPGLSTHDIDELTARYGDKV